MKDLPGSIRKWSIYSVLALILFIIILVVIGLFVSLAQGLLGGHFILAKEEVLNFFGQLLLVVIGVELFDTIHGLLYGTRVKANLVLLVAITAVSRELIVFNYEEADGTTVAGLGTLIASVSLGYYLIRRGLPKDKKVAEGHRASSPPPPAHPFRQHPDAIPQPHLTSKWMGVP